MIYRDYISVLTIDLTTESYRVDKRKDLLPYLGGVGIASKLLEENMVLNQAILAPEQCIVFAIGPLSTIFPVITKTVAMFWSPLTKELGESYAGGRMAMTLLMAHHDALVIKGKSRRPIYLSITNNAVLFKDASAFWGMDFDDSGRIIREKEGGAGKRSIIRIGKAGENGVKFASVCVDTYRHFGRLGLGAVMGSKNLKAICIYGKGDLPIQNQKAYFKAFTDIHTKALKTDMMKKYHDLGTAIGVNLMNEKGGIPIKNLQASSQVDIESLSGERFAEQNLIRKTACAGCPVGCIHIGQFRREFGEGFEYEAISVSYDYELIFSLGTFLGLSKSDEVLELIEIVEQYGMDAISAGVVLGWATEAYGAGLITEVDTLVPLEFGNQKNYMLALKHIAKRTNAFYEDLGEGSAFASAKYGGANFAMHFGGNEMAGYHTGYGSVLGSTVGARHSHLCNGGYGFDQGVEVSVEKLVDAVFEEEVHRCLLNSLVACLFARKIYDKPTIVSALESLGYGYTIEDLEATSRLIYKTKLRIKDKMGFEQKNIHLPNRFFETTGFGVEIKREVLDEMVAYYIKKCNELLSEA